jgi:omega-hydroxy-beta-dihydromenaquinone-9 sulfotransferase
MIRSGGGIDRGYRRRALFVLFIGLITAHVRLLERWAYGKRLRNLQVEHPPIFIVGHWRTGTTFLHNLMTQDPNLGYVSTLQAFAPECFLWGRHAIEPIMSRFMPETRPMDAVPFGTTVPQEEEFAICNTSPHSFFRGWYFPRSMPELFRKYVLFENISQEEIEEWAQVYVGVVKKATLASGGKRLVLKNPVNTGRMKAIVHLFPGAKFIFMHRNPFDVFPSTLKLYRSLLPWLGLQRIDEETIRSYVLSFYRDMMQRYLEERSTLPEGSLTEVRFEDLAERPLHELSRIYAELDIPDWEAARAGFESYIAARRGYKPDRYVMDQRDTEAIQNHWGFALDHWGYTQPD